MSNQVLHLNEFSKQKCPKCRSEKLFINSKEQTKLICGQCRNTITREGVISNDYKLLRRFYNFPVQTITLQTIDSIHRCIHDDCGWAISIFPEPRWTENAFCTSCGQHYCITSIRQKHLSNL